MIQGYQISSKNQRKHLSQVRFLMKFYDKLAKGHHFDSPLKNFQQIKVAHDAFKDEINIPSETLNKRKRRRATLSWHTEVRLWKTTLKFKKKDLDEKYDS